MSWENILKSFEARKESLVTNWKQWLKEWKYDYERAFPRTEQEEELKGPMSLLTLAIKRMDATDDSEELERWHKASIFHANDLWVKTGKRAHLRVMEFGKEIEGPESFGIDWDTKERNL